MIGDITTKDIQNFIDNHANPPSSDVKPLALSGLKRIIYVTNNSLSGIQLIFSQKFNKMLKELSNLFVHVWKWQSKKELYIKIHVMT